MAACLFLSAGGLWVVGSAPGVCANIKIMKDNAEPMKHNAEPIEAPKLKNH